MLTLDSIYFPTKIYAEKIEEVKVKNSLNVEKSLNQSDKR